MTQRKTKKTKAIVATGIALGASIAGAKAANANETPVPSSSAKFILPPKSLSNQLNSFSDFLKAISDTRIRQELLKDPSQLTPSMRDVLDMIGDSHYQQLVTEVNTVLAKVKSGEATTEELKTKSVILNDYMQSNYTDGYQALKDNYLLFVRNNGYAILEGQDVDNQSQMLMNTGYAYAGANTIAFANVFAVVNVSIWSNALAVILLVAI